MITNHSKYYFSQTLTTSIQQSAQTKKPKRRIKETHKEFHDIFARHLFDIGTNRDFKVTLTPNDDIPE